jgi:transposase-like protein
MFPRFDGLGRRETAVRWLPKEALVVPKPYPPEFRRRALDLLTSGRTVRDVAASSGIAESCLHRWKSLVLMDRGLKSPTPEAVESAALAVAQRRIVELEDEVKILGKAAAAVEEVVLPKCATASSPSSRLRASSSNEPASNWSTVRASWSDTTPSPCSWRAPAWPGCPCADEPNAPHPARTVTDLVKRDFRRNGPNQLWVTDITEHPTREGKLYCCVVLDTTLRRWFDSVAPPHRVSRGGQRWSSSMARGLVMPGVRAA